MLTDSQQIHLSLMKDGFVSDNPSRQSYAIPFSHDAGKKILASKLPRPRRFERIADASLNRTLPADGPEFH